VADRQVRGYLHKDYATVLDLDLGLLAYFHFYNHERSHQSLGYRPPAEVYLTTPQLAPAEPIP
jgi:putative transposase